MVIESELIKVLFVDLKMTYSETAIPRTKEDELDLTEDFPPGMNPI